MPSHHPKPWHRGSVFGTGPRRALDREQRARFAFLLRAHRRARRLTPLTEHIGVALLKRLSVTGQCDPSHDTLASDAGCSARTVRRATGSMRGLGLLRWQTRIVRSGWRTEQTSNAYTLVPADVPPVVSCGGQIGRETRKRRIISETQQDQEARESVTRQLEAVGITAEQARASLAARAAVVEAGLLGKWGG